MYHLQLVWYLIILNFSIKVEHRFCKQLHCAHPRIHKLMWLKYSSQSTQRKDHKMSKRCFVLSWQVQMPWVVEFPLNPFNHLSLFSFTYFFFWACKTTGCIQKKIEMLSWFKLSKNCNSFILFYICLTHLCNHSVLELAPLEILVIKLLKIL